MLAEVSSHFMAAPSAMPCVASLASLARGSWAPMGAPPAASLVGPSYHGMDGCPQPSLGVPSVHTSASHSLPSSSVSLLSRASRSPHEPGRFIPPLLDSLASQGVPSTKPWPSSNTNTLSLTHSSLLSFTPPSSVSLRKGRKLSFLGRARWWIVAPEPGVGAG